MGKEDQENQLGEIRKGQSRMRIDDQWCQEALKAVKDVQANVLVTSLNRQYSYDECKQFNVVASCTTGTDHIDNRDIPIISLQGETEFLQDIWATAEMTWALIMSLVRRIPGAFDDVKQGHWNREAFQGIELRGKTLGIVGYGRVGRQVAKLAEAFGMNVLWYDKTTNLNLTYILQRSDIVSVHVPLSAETKGMFGTEQFKQMQPTAYFINTSRGAVVDESALITALCEKWIAGAAIDVAINEPDIWNQLRIWHDRLIITPHISGNTAESRKTTQLFIASKIVKYIKESAK